ncbi:transmembrane protein 252-like isoform X1 [Gambusia affinis]|uniref:transmembrane protein 252-like isoform X1 n=1 Tax=Gambusia affinis TaxID=33528 RepID=UPI001CDBF0D2|nr:transmembrane protein 252-like isoform X1 [Gambusia affinis]
MHCYHLEDISNLHRRSNIQNTSSIMDVKKQLLSFARMFLPSVGFVFTCIGAYLVSQQNRQGFDHRMVPVYIMIVFGFLAMLIGVFWSLCHTMRSKMYHRRRHDSDIQIFTVESRPSSFPPPYEESQSPCHVCPGSMHEVVVSVDGVPVGLGVAPPLYTQNSSESPDCRWSWEQPPRYSQVVHTEPR